MARMIALLSTLLESFVSERRRRALCLRSGRAALAFAMTSSRGQVLFAQAARKCQRRGVVCRARPTVPSPLEHLGDQSHDLTRPQIEALSSDSTPTYTSLCCTPLLIASASHYF